MIPPVTLAVIRVLAGYSQAGLARASGVSQGHISGIEAGDKKATPEMLHKLADGMGLPIAALLKEPTPEQIAEARQRLGQRIPISRALGGPTRKPVA